MSEDSTQRPLRRAYQTFYNYIHSRFGSTAQPDNPSSTTTRSCVFSLFSSSSSSSAGADAVAAAEAKANPSSAEDVQTESIINKLKLIHYTSSFVYTELDFDLQLYIGFFVDKAKTKEEFRFLYGKSQPVSKEELGRATWTFLHTLAAQYPDHPTRQQQKDVRELISMLTRIYPCKECADHFKEVLRENPAQVASHSEFSQWLCRVHNIVNRSLGKPEFVCELINARWGKLECERQGCEL